MNVNYYDFLIFYFYFWLVFIIKKGEVTGVIPKFNDFCFMTIKEGYFFGEIDLLFNNEIR